MENYLFTNPFYSIPIKTKFLPSRNQTHFQSPTFNCAQSWSSIRSDGLCYAAELLLKIFIPERSSSLSSKRSILMDGYSTSKYTEDMFISPPSHCGSNISVSHDPQDYKVRPDPDNISLSDLSTSYLLLQYLGRSLSTGHDSDRGYNSYTTGQSSYSSYSVAIVLVECW